MNTRFTLKTKGMALFVALVLALVPVIGLASSASVPELGLTVAFPSNLDLFTKNMDGNDPLLKLYGKTAGQVAEELQSAGLTALAVDIAGEFTIGLVVSGGAFTDYGSMDEETLLAQAAALGSSDFELLEIAPGHALLVQPDAGHRLIARFQGASLAFELRLEAAGRVRSAMVSAVKGILRRVDISQGQ